MTNPFSHTHYDALVVGARCAGASTAMLLARAGLKVLLVERDTRLGDTLSTHALMRPAISLLHNWGVLERACVDTPTIGATHFTYGDQCLTIPVKPLPGMPGLAAPRRWLLDRVLADAAHDAGAEIRMGFSFEDVLRAKDGRVSGAVLRDRDGRLVRVQADLVVGADGRMSLVAASVGAGTQAVSDKAAATAYTYVSGLPNGGYRWFYDTGIAAGIIPTTNGSSCLFTSCRPTEFAKRFAGGTELGMARIIGRWLPELGDRIAAGQAVERPRRFAGAPGHIRECAGPGWALVGDAGYFKDPCTAHGITDAFLDAQRLADAVLSEDIAAYPRARDAHARGFFETTQAIASFDWTVPEVIQMHLRIGELMKAENAELFEATPLAA